MVIGQGRATKLAAFGRSPARPPTAAQLQAKISDCLAGLDLAGLDLAGVGQEPGAAAWTWPSAADLLRDFC